MHKPYLCHVVAAALVALPALVSAAGAAATPLNTAAVAPQAGAATASGAGLDLSWELLRAPAGAHLAPDRSPARFTLRNRDRHPLPAQGWSLYFNSLDRMPKGVQSNGIALEQAAGGLYRLHPVPGFGGLAPGQALQFDYRHVDSVYTRSKAPSGPYLVYDAAPARATAVGFTVQPLTQPAQAAGGGSPHALVTPQETYRRNARADLLLATALPPVLPTPLHVQQGDGRLMLTGRPGVDAPAALAAEAALASALFTGITGAGAGPVLRLRVGEVPGQASPEAYRLEIDAGSGIAIVGNSAAGVAYGLQTLRDLLPLLDSGAPSLPALTIVDAPRFGYRGFMLDVARNFHGKDVVFKWLDLMARFKLNKFHFHLTDDEGWRLEIAGLPELTEVGAVRGHAAAPGLRLQPAYGSGPDPRDQNGSGHFSRADYIEIVRYAAARHIEVIPEIEMPGHARAAVQAMAARSQRLQAAGAPDADRYLLQDPGDRSVYESAQHYNDNLIDPGLESSYTFIEHVVGAVAALHREAGVALHTIHMGGDEVPSGAWERSPASRALMARERMEGTADLWDYFYGRVDAIMRKHGLATSGWEELAARRAMVDGRSMLVPNPRFTGHGFTAYVWNNTPGAESLADDLANAGYDLVLAPVTRMYLDMAHNANPEEHGVNWGAYVELASVYDFVPFEMGRSGRDGAQAAGAGAASGTVRLTEAGRRHVRGLQATLFTETVRDPARIDHLVMPRLAAVAERAWAPDPDWAREADPVKAAALHRRAWSGFVNALGQRVLPRLDLEQSGLAYRIAPPGMTVEGGKVLVNHVLPGMVLRYTRDGSVPTAASARVDGPIAARGTLRAAAFDRNGRRGEVATIEHR